MKVAITGITGNMGQATLNQLEGVNCIEKIKLLGHSKRLYKQLRKHKKMRDKIEVVEGSLANYDAVRKLIDGVDLVINMAAVIPPKSDQKPLAAIECNEKGAAAIVKAVEESENQPALIHVSTVALYGNRTGNRRFARVGDPLPVSPFDLYAATKLRGEFGVLESNIEKWAVLRQTAMLHPQMLTDNIHDGLMFHTVFDAPLEWATAHDSGLLIKNIIVKFAEGSIPESFWKKCYNIAGGDRNRSFGLDTFDDGFSIIGGSAKAFFRPYYNATRNFHGVWYLDGNQLNDLFEFQTQSVKDYWQEVLKAHPVYKLGKIVPKSLVARFTVQRLLDDPNSPYHWAHHGDEAKLIAYFGSRENYEKLLNQTWDDFPLPDRTRIPEMEREAETAYYGFDFSKADEDINISDLKSVAEAHGGKLLSEKFDKGDMYAKVEWENQDGERFTATPYTVLRAGHWINPIYRENVWDFDRLAKKDKILASVWYDSHDSDEDVRYYYDENFIAHAEKI